jgi:predicted nucleic-acid-binding protein
VRSFDTNVAVRLVVEDDPAQCERAKRAFQRAIDDGGVFFTATVLVEVAWVLRGAFKQDRATIAAALRRLVGSAGVVVEHDAVVRRALVAFETGPADFSDYVIRESSQEVNALPVVTFDERFAREADVELVPGT